MKNTIKKIKTTAFIIILIQVLIIGAFALFYFNNFFNFKSLINVEIVILGVVSIVFINIIFIWTIIAVISRIRNSTDLKAAQIIGSDVQEAYNFAMIGLAVTDEHDVVLWTNELFKERHIDITDSVITEIYPDLEELKNANSDKSCKIVIGNRDYNVKYLQDAGLWIFKDITELESTYKYSKEQAPVVGLLSIDNYADATRGEDDTNDIITKLKNLIFNYCKEYNVLLRRYRDDTYLFLCNYDSFSKMKANHFSIIDKARSLSSEEEAPLTLSIGIAHEFPDVVKLNEMASNALDIAMSRGGDQVVVNAYGHEMEFFGGKSQAQETRNRVKTRVLADSLISLIKNAEHVYIAGHKDMDMDALGAALGIRAICTRLGIKSHIVVDYRLTEAKTRGALLTQFSKSELDELIISPSDAEEAINPNDMLVVVDVHIPSMVMDPLLVEKATKVVVIDHHRRAEEYIDSPVFNYIDSAASSSCEIITEFIRFSSLSPRVDLPSTYATIMLSGIFLDTNYFKSKQTGVRTFEASSILKDYGADNGISDDLLKDDIEEHSIVSSLVNQMKTPSYGIVYAMGDEKKVYDTATLAKAANTFLTMKGIHAAFVFAKINNKDVRMSCRSDGLINVQLLAEKMGGGGHFTSAAATFDKLDLNQVEELLLDTFDKYLKDANADNKTRRMED